MIYDLYPEAINRTSVLFAIESMVEQYERQGREADVKELLECEAVAMREEIAIRKKSRARELFTIVRTSSLTVFLLLIARFIATKLGIGT